MKTTPFDSDIVKVTMRFKKSANVWGDFSTVRLPVRTVREIRSEGVKIGQWWPLNVSGTLDQQEASQPDNWNLVKPQEVAR